METCLDLPTLSHAGMNYRPAKILLWLFDNIEDAQLAALKVDAVGIRMAKKQTFGLARKCPWTIAVRLLPTLRAASQLENFEPCVSEYFATMRVSSKS